MKEEKQLMHLVRDLLDAIDQNINTFWTNDLSDVIDCIVLNEETFKESTDKNATEVSFTGIQTHLESIEKLLNQIDKNHDPKPLVYAPLKLKNRIVLSGRDELTAIQTVIKYLTGYISNGTDVYHIWSEENMKALKSFQMKLNSVREREEGEFVIILKEELRERLQELFCRKDIDSKFNSHISRTFRKLYKDI